MIFKLWVLAIGVTIIFLFFAIDTEARSSKGGASRSVRHSSTPKRGHNPPKKQDSQPKKEASAQPTEVHHHHHEAPKQSGNLASSVLTGMAAGYAGSAIHDHLSKDKVAETAPISTENAPISAESSCSAE
ncbi:MAG: hypothetical protein DRQ48_00825 [Gammaproteobacteria bacterium]|nr:MAG: hypothetical protein DRQ44_00545 [Gammaproteobacteria bacterium]RKZ72222.1 MAG: hypothetical protein DRQ48_00825 [Gammaproteobacteria bacterium]